MNTKKNSFIAYMKKATTFLNQSLIKSMAFASILGRLKERKLQKERLKLSEIGPSDSYEEAISIP